MVLICLKGLFGLNKTVKPILFLSLLYPYLYNPNTPIGYDDRWLG